MGQANLTIRPYFYSTNELILDAKGFDIHSINMNGKELSFEYDSLQLFIQLDREYQRNEQYIINIDYTAKPNDLKIEGSDAITEAKGLYFINPLGEEDKPQQIWTKERQKLVRVGSYHRQAKRTYDSKHRYNRKRRVCYVKRPFGEVRKWRRHKNRLLGAEISPHSYLAMLGVETNITLINGKMLR